MNGVVASGEKQEAIFDTLWDFQNFLEATGFINKVWNSLSSSVNPNHVEYCFINIVFNFRSLLVKIKNR